MLFQRKELESALPIVREFVPETPAYAWPLLQQRLGVHVHVKHENHTPIGAFKARSLHVYLKRLIEREGKPSMLVTATRGNHGQAVALTARNHGIPATVVVPKGNAEGKNRAMACWGATVVVKGADYEESRAVADRIAAEANGHFVPAFHSDIVLGVATYAWELFHQVPDLDVVYVPIGMGSGICGLISVRDLLGLKTEIVGVVAENAPAYRLSFEAGHPVQTETASTFADGMACRNPMEEALSIICAGASRIVAVDEDAIAEAIRVLFADTHNVAEGAGAAAMAALMMEQERYQGRRAGAILCGGNIDESVLLEVLAGRTPVV